MPDPRSRRRSLALAAGCAAVVALLAATPLAWFALSDAALLDRPAAMDQPYTSLVPTGWADWTSYAFSRHTTRVLLGARGWPAGPR